jgi:hypothetical protein
MIECPRCGNKTGKGGKYKYILCHDCMEELNKKDGGYINRIPQKCFLDNDKDEMNYEPDWVTAWKKNFPFYLLAIGWGICLILLLVLQ